MVPNNKLFSFFKRFAIFSVLVGSFLMLPASSANAQDPSRPRINCQTGDLLHTIGSRIFRYDRFLNDFVEFVHPASGSLNATGYNDNNGLLYATNISGGVTVIVDGDAVTTRYNLQAVSGAEVDFTNAADIDTNGNYVLASNANKFWLVDNFVEGVDGANGTADTREITPDLTIGSPEIAYNDLEDVWYTMRGQNLIVSTIDFDALTVTRISRTPILGLPADAGSTGAMWIDSGQNLVIYDEDLGGDNPDALYSISAESIAAGAPAAVKFANVLNQTFSTDGGSCPGTLAQIVDQDQDNDGIKDIDEGFRSPLSGEESDDTDGDGIPDYLDLDSDNDGVPDTFEAIPDGGTILDTDRDGVIDSMEDADGDGIPDSCDVDQTAGSDTIVVDGIIDSCQGGTDSDFDGINDANDPDANGNGLADEVDTVAGGTDIIPNDQDGDGTPDASDFDSDNDGLTDVQENELPDADGDGQVDCASGDTNANGFCDDYDTASGGTAATVIDSDGDGATDFRTPLDGLVGPIYFIWNGFLNQFNTAVLVNKLENEQAIVELTLLDIQGNEFSSITLGVPPKGERDFVINELEGFGADTYGTLKIDFDGIATIDGNSLHFRFRPDNAAEAEFSHQKPFSNSVLGTSYAVSNTVQSSQNPFELQNSIIHWLQIANHNETATKRFTVNRFDGAGVLFDTNRVSIPPLGRRDIQAGHEDILGLNGFTRAREIGLVQVIPDDAGSPYGGELFRYGGDALPGVVPNTYSFGLSQNLEQGDNGTQYAFVSNGADGVNFAEIYNTSGQDDVFSIEVIENSGELRFTQSIPIAENAQFHVSISDKIGAGQSGIIKVSSESGRSFVMRSSVYFFEPDLSISASYSETGRSRLFSDSNFGNYNTFLGQFNFLKLFNVSNQEVIVGVEVTDSEGVVIGQSGVVLPANTGGDFELNAQLFLNVPADTVGRVQVSTSAANAVTGTLLRVRNSDFGPFVDFAKPLPIR